MPATTRQEKELEQFPTELLSIAKEEPVS